VAVLAATATIAPAEQSGSSTLTVHHARVVETPPVARAGGGYLVIENRGSTDDALIGVSADYPRVELHESREVDGVMTMRPVERLEIPAGESVELAPGGLHVMFMGLTPDTAFTLGESVSVTLLFEQAGEVEVAMEVVPRSAAATGNGGHEGH
jgi:hypothetical protein